MISVTTPGRNTNMEMNINTNSTAPVGEESQSNVPTPPSRQSSNQYQKLESPREDSFSEPNRGQNATASNENRRTMETVYENESAEAMIPPPIQNTVPNAPPLPDSPRESFEVNDRFPEETRMLPIGNNVSNQNYDDMPYIIP